ncbi:SIS domain-containing protein [Nanoarchaeota archaeon NZ13-N]|nr:MAG: SIS domain-containing protein [Nanoarchaeota archaeon NZ13-N]
MEVKFFNKRGEEVEKKPLKLKWVDFDIKKEFEHFMIKEIYEQPLVSKILIDSLRTEQSDIVNKFLDEIEKANRIVFIAAGSSYHSSLMGSRLLRELGYEAYSVLASEYKDMKYDKNTLIIAVSQSGETMDVILALKDLKERAKKVLSVVNVPYSTIQRISDSSLEIKAGPEKCVAATKTYTNQVIAFLYLANRLGMKVNVEEIPDEINRTINMNEEKVKEIARDLKEERDIFIIGRGINYYSSLEISLKLKEISYIHAEALAGGELKHGTLALIEKGTKVLALNPSWDIDIKTNIEEVASRGGVVYEIPKDFYAKESYPNFSLYSVIVGQLLTYYTAREKGLPIDYPRNLAKSVTVK